MMIILWLLNLLKAGKKMIGIIGGNGVAATNKLNDLIEEEYTKNGAFRDAHHPELLIWQATQAPSRSMFLEGKGKSFIEDYISIAKKLKLCGAKKIAMCCNTAHYAIDEISDKSGIEFIDLIDAVVNEVKRTGIRRVGLVASDGCIRGNVYKKYFERLCPDTRIIYPDPDFQALVTKGICNTKNIHRFDDINSEERPNFIFKRVREHLYTKGAGIVVMGCTDIRVDYYDDRDIDSLEVLKKRIINEFL